ncbi:MAG TPA: hypothetical protein VFL85_03900 [Candidatus Saccharimonadales bacterium]|nr:hypothetical protein [Candidatus Saccharimonadales bacterium]
MTNELPPDPLAQPNRHHATILATLLAKFRNREATEQPNQIRVIGDAAGVISTDAIPILSESLRDKYGVDPGNVTIVAERIRKPDENL